MTYKSLHQQANQLACLLSSQLPQHSIVAVCTHRCLFSYIAVLAIQISENIYLPIDENFPSERQRLLLNDSVAVCLITKTAMEAHFEHYSGCIIFYHDDTNFRLSLQRMDIIWPTVKYSPADLAYILHTSGSTAKPKGCKLTRRNLAAAIEGFRAVLEEAAPRSLNSGVRFLAHPAELFDVVLLETILPIRVGGTIVTDARDMLLSDLSKAMAATRVIHAAVVPSLLFSGGKRIRSDHLPPLRTLIVGGESLRQDVVDNWDPSNLPLLNAYGPTETAIGSSIGRITSTSSPKNVGRTFPGTQYVVARRSAEGDRIVPALRGESGELCILSVQVGAGYLGDTISTAFDPYKDFCSLSYG